MTGKENFTDADLAQRQRIRVLRAEHDRLDNIQQRQKIQIAELLAKKAMMQEKVLHEQAAHELRVAIYTTEREARAAARASEAARQALLDFEGAVDEAGRVPPGDGEEVAAANDDIAAASSDK